MRGKVIAVEAPDDDDLAVKSRLPEKAKSIVMKG
jgi:hypothetical protein